MQVRLEVTHDKANVKRVVLSSDAVLGRSTSCSLRIASSLVSRRHCRISLTDAGVLVRDLESSNGTFLDGERLTPNEDVFVAPDSILSLGGVEFVVRYDLPQSVPTAGPGSTVDLPMAGDDSSHHNPSEHGPVAAVEMPVDEIVPVSGSAPPVVQDEPEADTGFSQPPHVPSADETPQREEPRGEEPGADAPTTGEAADDDAPDVEAFRFTEPQDSPEDAADQVPAANVSFQNAEEPAADDAQEAEADDEEDSAPPGRGGLRSLFGLFGRKRGGASERPPYDAQDDEASADVAQDTQGPADQTVEEVPPGEFPATEDADASEEEAAGFLFDQDAESGEDGPDDNDLGDFLRQLDQR